MSEHLNPAQLEQLKTDLLGQRDRLLERGVVEITADDQAEPMDNPEKVSGEMARSEQSALTDMDRRQLLEVQFALSRMSEGSYGECEESGEPIPFGRLVAEPTTRYTIEAQEQAEADASRAKAIERDSGGAAY
ncbi:MAG: TraR/DksA family transcriptional regulator [Nannocystaceae bacterium]|nr:TraR/DksA family transcriptional regulator [Nannocystaceae bacterium]